MYDLFDCLPMQRGEDFQRSWFWKDAAGAPVQMPGASAEARIMDRLNGKVLLVVTTAGVGTKLTLDTAGGGVGTGQIDLAVKAEDLETIWAGLPAPGWIGDFDIRLTFQGGQRVFPVGGPWTLAASATFTP